MTKAEYLLVCLMEESCEIAQAASKALRFGVDDNYPGYGDNAGKLQQEISDLLAIWDELILAGVFKRLPKKTLLQQIKEKKERLYFFIGYSKNKGIINDEPKGSGKAAKGSDPIP